MQRGIAALQWRIAEVQRGIASMQWAIAVVQRGIAALQWRIAEVQRGIASMQWAIAVVQRSIAALQWRIAEVQRRIATVQWAIVVVQRSIASLQWRIAEVQRSIASMQRGIAVVQRHIAGLRRVFSPKQAMERRLQRDVRSRHQAVGAVPVRQGRRGCLQGPHLFLHAGIKRRVPILYNDHARRHSGREGLRAGFETPKSHPRVGEPCLTLGQGGTRLVSSCHPLCHVRSPEPGMHTAARAPVRWTPEPLAEPPDASAGWSASGVTVPR
jgi:prefoldin subunit 5